MSEIILLKLHLHEREQDARFVREGVQFAADGEVREIFKLVFAIHLA